MQQLNRAVTIMRIYTDDENLAIITSQKTIRVDLSIKINKSLRHDIKNIKSCN